VNLIEMYVSAVNKLKADYFYHRQMMNYYWPNPYKSCPEINTLLYRSHRNNLVMIGHAFTEAGINLYPRKDS
jgi:hypothetical protein